MNQEESLRIGYLLKEERKSNRLGNYVLSKIPGYPAPDLTIEANNLGLRGDTLHFLGNVKFESVTPYNGVDLYWLINDVKSNIYRGVVTIIGESVDITGYVPGDHGYLRDHESNIVTNRYYRLGYYLAKRQRLAERLV